ncbi:transglutaminase family protein [Pseudokineococcus sp. 1T1Z-3]|uniref:transglutaminase family protein n=1 Tax=Pseudokineococcus sp. 1T1Z-3 TaxID=3132745 RepID=UPI0030A35A20
MSVPTERPPAPARRGGAGPGRRPAGSSGSTSVPVGALGGLAVLGAAAPLLPLVEGSRWYLDTVGVVALVVLAGALVGQVTGSVLLRVGAQVVVVVCALTALHLPGGAALGVVPGPASVSAARQLLADGWAVVEESVPPVADPPGLRLLLVGAVALLAVCVDVLAAALRRPALAGLPLLAVVVTAGALLREGMPAGLFAAAALPYLLLLAADGPGQTTRWGRTATRWRREAGGAAGGSAGAAVAVVLVGALAAALVVPALGPWRSTGSLALGGTGGGVDDEAVDGRVNPLLDLAQDLDQRSDATALTYELLEGEDAVEPLRLVSVDAFDGQTWRPREEGAAAEPLEAGAELPEPPGLDVDAALAGGTAAPQRVSVSVVGLRQEYLPAPYPATSVDLAGDGWLVDPGTLDLLAAPGTTTTRGQSYEVDVLRLQPREEDLVDGGPVPGPVRSTWTALPEDLPPEIAEIAAEVAGEGEPLQQAARLQAFFRSTGGFTYSEQAPGGTGTGSVSAFLERRSGYCVHFASAMALMARSLDLPARVSVGFLPGTRQPDGRYEVSFSDAHAWPEVYVGGTGWVRFEPTPGVRTGAAPAWTDVGRADAAVEEAEAAEEAVPEPAPEPEPAPAPEAPGAPEGGGDGAGGLPLRAVLLPLALVAGLAGLLLAPAGAAAALRRRRWRRAEQEAAAGNRLALVDRADDDLRRGLADLGAPASPGATPRSEETRLAALVSTHPRPEVQGEGSPTDVAQDGLEAATPADPALGARLARLRAAQEAARYAPVALPPSAASPDRDRGRDRGPDAETRRPGGRRAPAAGSRTGPGDGDLRADVDGVLAAVAASVSRPRRWRVRWVPLAHLRR